MDDADGGEKRKEKGAKRGGADINSNDNSNNDNENAFFIYPEGFPKNSIGKWYRTIQCGGGGGS